MLAYRVGEQGAGGCWGKEGWGWGGGGGKGEARERKLIGIKQSGQWKKKEEREKKEYQLSII